MTREMEYCSIYLVSLMESVADSLIPEEKKKQCPVCGNRCSAFLPFGAKPRGNAQCPFCKSLERHRALWKFFQERQMIRGGRLLHFAPEKAFFDQFSSMEDIDYWPVDINPKRYKGMIRKAVDISEIPFENDSVDWILCNHVLEHIPDEKKALSELYRVLRADGTAILNVPVRNVEKTLENPEYNTPELRLKYYGQGDHVRAYGRDYPDRLRQVGFKVEVVEYGKRFSDSDLRKFGISSTETFYLARK